jgi:hypothetical protein
MITVEKNDVDITKLFDWGRKFEIKDRKGKVITPVFIRLVGDSEINQARVFALRESSKLRKQLKTENSDERLIYIPDLGEYAKEQLVDLIISLQVSDFFRDAYSEIKIPEPIEPDSDAPLEKQEKYQQEVDNYPSVKREAISVYVDKQIEKAKKEKSSVSREDLEKEYERFMINNLCENEMVNKYREMCIYFGCFLDEDYNKRMFSSFDKFSNLRPEIKEQLASFYTELEIGIDDLKK